MGASQDPFDAGATSLLRQPKAVWATAGASVVAFMGIGLVDPILPSIAQGLDATASQVSLLFTSYFLITAIAMLVTGFVSSRIGGKKTLLLGLALVVVFAGLAGTSGSVEELVGFRAGWGLGNALFVSTALAVIVGAAAGGSAAAILLYESALGLGMACGPLLGALLGDASWRYPFFGTAFLMAIGFLCITVFLKEQPKPARKTSLLDPIKALGHGGLASAAVSSFFYNYTFFTVLAFTPFVLDMTPYKSGAVFFAWGVLLAVFSVFAAPRLKEVRFAQGAQRLTRPARARRARPRLRQPHGGHRLHDPVRRLHRREQHRLHGAGARRLGRPAARGERGLQLRALVRGGCGALLRAEDRGVDRHPHPVRGGGGDGGAGRARGRRTAEGAHPPHSRIRSSGGTPMAEELEPRHATEDSVAVFAN